MRSNILHGAYPDSKLPPEHELMARYDAPRAVIRDALALLRHDGLVDRVQGYGTYALQPPGTHDLYDIHGVDHTPGTGFWQSVTRTQVISLRVVDTPDAVAGLMRGAGERCVQLDYVAYQGDEAVAVATNHFRLPRCAAVVDQPIRTDFYELLSRAGIEVGATQFFIGAGLADPHLAATLEVPVSTPVVNLEQVIYAPDGEAIDVAFIWMRADRVLLESFVAGPGYARSDRRSMTSRPGRRPETLGS